MSTHIYRLLLHSTCTAYNRNKPRSGSPKILKKKNICKALDQRPLKGCVIGGRLRAMTHLGMISYQGPAGTCDGRAQVTLGYRSGGRIAVRLITSGPSDRKLVSQPFHVVPQPIWTCCVNSHIQTALAQHLHSI